MWVYVDNLQSRALKMSLVGKYSRPVQQYVTPLLHTTAVAFSAVRSDLL